MNLKDNKIMKKKKKQNAIKQNEMRKLIQKKIQELEKTNPVGKINLSKKITGPPSTSNSTKFKIVPINKSSVFGFKKKER